MALPDPSNQMKQYQPRSNREAIGTHTSAALLQMQINMLSKSPLLRMIPGSGILKERAEFKKRERYEKTGRDESGRKLTKDEFEDREKRRKDLGALASIQEMLQKLLIDKKLFVPVQIMDSKKDMTGGGQPVINSSEEGAYSLEVEEAAVEKERADDADDDKTSKRQEGFFSKLFGFGGKKKGEGGGILGALLGLVASIGSFIKDFFKGGVDMLMKSLITPLLGALAGNLGGLAALIGSLMPLLLAGAIGASIALVVRKWINTWSDMQDEASNLAGSRGIEQRYSVKDPSGKTSMMSAQELGMSDDDVKGGLSSPIDPTLEIDPMPINMETKGGKPTGVLSDINSPAAIGKYFKENPVRFTEDQQKLSDAYDMEDWRKRIEYLRDINASMYQYSARFQSIYEDPLAIQNEDTMQTLVDGWNNIKSRAEAWVDGSTKLGYGDAANALIDSISNQYAPFVDMHNGKKFAEGKATTSNTLGFAGMMLPSVTEGKRALTPEESRLENPKPTTNLYGGGAGYRRLQSATENSPIPTLSNDNRLQSATENSPIPTLSNDNAMLKNAQSAAPTIIAPTTNTVAQTNTAISSGGPSARQQQTGGERSANFNFNGGMSMMA